MNYSNLNKNYKLGAFFEVLNISIIVNNHFVNQLIQNDQSTLNQINIHTLNLLNTISSKKQQIFLEKLLELRYKHLITRSQVVFLINFHP